MADTPVPGSKKRRLQGSCDNCRIRKIKCDSAQRPGNKCTSCIVCEIACTHVAAMSRKNRGLPQNANSWDTASVVDDVQQHINEILSKTKPYVVPKDTSIVHALITELARYARLLENKVAAFESAQCSRPQSLSSSPKADHDDREDDSVHTMEAPMSRLDLSEGSSQFGASSDAKFIVVAKDLKKQINPKHSARRPEFWYPQEWQYLPKPEKKPLVFPSQDLIDDLVTLYFNTLNQHFCLLHGPTVLRQIAAGVHYECHSFGSVVLAVCALAARHSTDPRVGDGQRAGWEWYKQLKAVGPGEPISAETSLWDLQLFPLMVQYAYGLTVIDQCWLLTGMGIRMAQAMHIHRLKRKEGVLWTASDEMLKRAWWALMMLDVYVSTLTGRVRMTNPDQFDTEYPIEIDDEYWPGEIMADPSTPWTQPPEVPSQLAGWIYHLKLLDIYTFSQTTIYSIRRSRFWDAISTSEWGQNIAVELDSALNGWLDALPDYLRWKPHAPTETSALLYIMYYWVQIEIHRPFLTVKNGFSSTAICATAARSCAHVVHVHDAAFGTLPLTSMFPAILHSSIILLLNARNGLAKPRDMEDVKLSMRAIARHEDRFEVAGRYHDVLQELVDIVELPAEEVDSRKRKERDDDNGDYERTIDFYGVNLEGTQSDIWDTWDFNLEGWPDFNHYFYGANG